MVGLVVNIITVLFHRLRRFFAALTLEILLDLTQMKQNLERQSREKPSEPVEQYRNNVDDEPDHTGDKQIQESELDRPRPSESLSKPDIKTPERPKLVPPSALDTG